MSIFTVKYPSDGILRNSKKKREKTKTNGKKQKLLLQNIKRMWITMDFTVVTVTVSMHIKYALLQEWKCSVVLLVVFCLIPPKYVQIFFCIFILKWNVRLHMACTIACLSVPVKMISTFHAGCECFLQFLPPFFGRNENETKMKRTQNRRCHFFFLPPLSYCALFSWSRRLEKISAQKTEKKWSESVCVCMWVCFWIGYNLKSSKMVNVEEQGSSFQAYFSFTQNSEPSSKPHVHTYTDGCERERELYFNRIPGVFITIYIIHRLYIYICTYIYIELLYTVQWTH